MKYVYSDLVLLSLEQWLLIAIKNLAARSVSLLVRCFPLIAPRGFLNVYIHSIDVMNELHSKEVSSWIDNIQRLQKEPDMFISLRSE